MLIFYFQNQLHVFSSNNQLKYKKRVYTVDHTPSQIPTSPGVVSSKNVPLRAQLVYKWLGFSVLLVREPAIGLIKWLRSKGLKVWSYVEKCAEFKNQCKRLKSRLVHKSAMCNLGPSILGPRCNVIPWGRQYLKKSA